MVKSSEEIKVYFVSIPAHKFLHIKNYESNGYWDFWEKQDNIPGMDCDTICGLLDSVKGKLDGDDNIIGKFSGQIMAYLSEGERTAEAYGIRLPADYDSVLPTSMITAEIPLRHIARYFSGLLNEGGLLILEFVPKEDSQTQRLLAVRRDVHDDYHLEGMRAAFSEFFQEIESANVPDSLRTLHVFRRR